MERIKAEKSNIAISNTDMSLLHFAQLPMSSFGMLSMSFAQQIMDRTDVSTGAVPMFTLDYLKEGEEAGPANVTVSPVLNLDFHFLLQELERLEKSRAAEKNAREKKTEKKIEEKVIFVRQGDVYRLENMSQEERSRLQIRKLTERCAVLQDSRLEKERKIHPHPKAVAKESAGSSVEGKRQSGPAGDGGIVYTESYSMDPEFLNQFLEKQEEERKKQEELLRQQFDRQEAAGPGKKKGRSGKNGRKSKEASAVAEQKSHTGIGDLSAAAAGNDGARFTNEELFDSISAAERKNAHSKNLPNAAEAVSDTGAAGLHPAGKQEEYRAIGLSEDKERAVPAGKPERNSVYLPERKSEKRRKIAGARELPGKLIRRELGMPQAEMLFTNVLQAEQRLGLTYGSEIGDENLSPKDRAAYLKATTERIRRKEQLAEDLAVLPTGILPPEELFFLKELSETPGLPERLLTAAENEVKRAFEILKVREETKRADLTGGTAAEPEILQQTEPVRGGKAESAAQSAVLKHLEKIAGEEVNPAVQPAAAQHLEKTGGDETLPAQQGILHQTEPDGGEETRPAAQTGYYGFLEELEYLNEAAANGTEEEKAGLTAVLKAAGKAAAEAAAEFTRKNVEAEAAAKLTAGKTVSGAKKNRGRGEKSRAKSIPGPDAAGIEAKEAPVLSSRAAAELIGKLERAVLTGGTAGRAVPGITQQSGQPPFHTIQKSEQALYHAIRKPEQTLSRAIQKSDGTRTELLPGQKEIFSPIELTGPEEAGTAAEPEILQQTEPVRGEETSPAAQSAILKHLEEIAGEETSSAAQTGYYGFLEELEYLNEAAANGTEEEKAGLTAVLKAAGKAAAEAAAEFTRKNVEAEAAAKLTAGKTGSGAKKNRGRGEKSRAKSIPGPDAAGIEAKEAPVLSSRAAAELIGKLERAVLTGGTAGRAVPGITQQSGQPPFHTIQKSEQALYHAIRKPEQTLSRAIQKSDGTRTELLPGQKEIFSPIELTGPEEAGTAAEPEILQQTEPVRGGKAESAAQSAILKHSEGIAGEEVNPAAQSAMLQRLARIAGEEVNPAAQTGYYGFLEELEYLNEAAANGTEEEKAGLTAVLKAAGKAAAEAAAAGAAEFSRENSGAETAAKLTAGKAVSGTKQDAGSAERVQAVPVRGIRKEPGEPEKRQIQGVPSAERGFFADRPLDMSYVSTGADSGSAGPAVRQMAPSGAEPDRSAATGSEYYRSLPEWTRNFLEDSYRNPEGNRQQSEKTAGIPSASGEGTAIPAQTGISWSNPNISSSYSAGTSSEDIVLKNPQEKEEPQVRITEREIRRTADKVYKILEERLRNERRRHGF